MSNFFFDTTYVPSYAIKVARILINEGFDCYLVGGSVRDILLGQKNGFDIDFTTNATPEQLIKLDSFPKTVQINERFGTIAVLVQDETSLENFQVEITTYRKEEDYFGGRWPGKVEFGISLEEDLKRRDFTFNALAIDMKTLVANSLDPNDRDEQVKIIDLFGGLDDLRSGIVRAVGDPIERFSEDGLRPIRAVRFASRFGFQIESQTFDAIKTCLEITSKVSIERFRDEFVKMLMKSPTPSVGLRLMDETGILKIFIPELLEGKNVTQKLFHAHDVWNHCLACLDVAPDNIKIAALFHDIGKPRCDTHDGHFYGHDKVGAEMAKEILTRLHFSNNVVNRVSKLISEHMFFYPDDANWTDGAVRRFINRVGIENISDLFALRIADATCNPKHSWDSTEIQRLETRVAKILEEDSAMKVTDLNVDGNDLQAIGLQGKQIGDTLAYLLEQVLDDPKKNMKETLITLAKELNKI